MAFQVVAVEKESNDEFVHLTVFGKRKGFADPPSEALAQGVVEALDGVRPAVLGRGGLGLSSRQHVGVALVNFRRNGAISISA